MIRMLYCIPKKERGDKMIVYAIVTHYMEGNDVIAVFSSFENAKNFLATYAGGGSPEIVKKQVQGKIKEKNKVYPAGTYDRVADIHNLIGIYGNYEDAKKLSGEGGLVLTMDVDGRVVNKCFQGTPNRTSARSGAPEARR